MSVALSGATPQTAERYAVPLASSQHRRVLLVVVVAATSLTGLGLTIFSYLRPVGSGDLFLDFAAIQPRRAELWSFFVLAAVNLIVGVCAAALAGWLLAPARGAAWATAGGSLVWLGAAAYGVGVGGWAAVYYFASDAATLGVGGATALIDTVNEDTLRMFVLPFGGAVIIRLGTLLLSVGLWRARTVPRWVIVLGLASTIATLVLPPSTAPGVVAEGIGAVTTIALGWYVWRRYQPRADVSLS